MQDLVDKVVVITGAGSGIGRGLATKFAEAGAKLALADVDAEGLEATVKALRDGVETVLVPTDVSEPGAVEALARKTFDSYGAAHVLCNNAGVGTTGFVWEHAPPDWDWIFGVNVWGVVNGLRAFVPRFIEQGEEAHVVNTSSMLGLHGAPLSGPYAASKHAVLAITEALRQDLQIKGVTNIGVSVLCPGPVQTSLAAERDRPEVPVEEPAEVENWKKVMDQVLLGGMAPDRVAAAVVEAVLEGRFWIFPAPEYAAGAKARIEEIELAIGGGSES